MFSVSEAVVRMLWLAIYTIAALSPSVRILNNKIASCDAQLTGTHMNLTQKIRVFELRNRLTFERSLLLKHSDEHWGE